MAAGSTYTPIATNTLSSGQNTVTFSSIASSYTDLVLVFSGSSASGQALLVRVNGDTGSNYSETALYGTGTSAASYRDSSVAFAEVGGVWNSQNITIINFMNYSNTSTYKTFLARNNDAGFRTQATVCLWRSTSAINSISIFPNSSVNFNSGSTFTLYGILAA